MTQNEVIEKLKKSIEIAISTTTDLDEKAFFVQINNKWSIAENLEHLSKSAKGFNKALEMPKSVLENFGKPEKPSRSYEDLVAFYQATLATLVMPVNPFAPKLEQNLQDKNEILEKFKVQHEALLTHFLAWNETDLEAFEVPHPALGKLTMREMFYFMAYHIEHHQTAIDKILQDYL